LLELSSFLRPQLLSRLGVFAHNTFCLERRCAFKTLLLAVGPYCRPDFGLCEVVHKRCCVASLKLIASGSMQDVSAITGVSTCSTLELLSSELCCFWPALSLSASQNQLGHFMLRSRPTNCVACNLWPFPRHYQQLPWLLIPACRPK
jgi:hypothetical protein